MLPFGTGGFLHFDALAFCAFAFGDLTFNAFVCCFQFLRVQFTIAATLSGRKFDAVGRFFYGLAEARLRDEGGVTDQPVVAFHFPFIFHGEGEGRVVALVIIEIIVRGERGTVFALLKVGFLYLTYSLS